MIYPTNQISLLNKKHLFWIFIFSIILTGICFFHVKDLNGPVVLNDEFGYWSIAASISGKNWRDLIAITPYYNYGYSILLVPLFYLKFPFYIIYKIAITMNIGMLVLAYWLCVFCAKKLFPLIKNYQIILGSFFVCIYPSTILQTQIAWTETLLYLLFWISVSLILSLEEKYSLWKVILFEVSLGYMFMVHQRTIGVLIGGILVLFLYIYKNRNVRKKDILIFCIILIALISLHFIVKSDLKNWLWDNSVTSSMNDFSAQISRYEKYFSLNALKNIFFGISGRIFYFFVTGGLIFCCGLYYLLRSVLKIIVKRKIDIENKLFLVAVFILCSFFSLLAIGTVSIVEGFERVDTVVYARYIENVIGPILLFGCFKMLQSKLNFRYFMMFVVVLFLTAFTTWHISNSITSPSFVDVCSIGLAQFYNVTDKGAFIYNATIYALILNIIIFAVINLKLKNWKFLLIFIMVSVCWLNTANYTYKNTIEKYQNNKTENNEWLANIIDAQGVSKVYYIIDPKYDAYATNVKYLQFWIPDIEIKVINREDMNELNDCIWICDKQSEFADANIENSSILGESSELYLCTRKTSHYSN